LFPAVVGGGHSYLEYEIKSATAERERVGEYVTEFSIYCVIITALSIHTS